MSNFAAFYGLARSGAFRGLFDTDFDLLDKAACGIACAVDHVKDKRVENAEKDWNTPLSRFKDAPFHSDLIENYLKGGAKLVWDTDANWKSQVHIKTKKGKKVSVSDEKLAKEEASQYREFIEQKLEMIEPPSFLEKLMVANKTLTKSKAGRIASTVSVGVIPAAVGLAALSARAYGATRGFIMEKLDLRNKNQHTFKERLATLKDRVDYKHDLKMLPAAENVIQNVTRKKEEREDLQQRCKSLEQLIPNASTSGKCASEEFRNLIKITDHPNLAGYLDGRLTLYNDGRHSCNYVYFHARDSKQDLDYAKAGTRDAKPATSQNIAPYIDRYTKALDMIEPPTKTELSLLKQLHQLSRTRTPEQQSPLVEAAEQTVRLYINEKQKENKNYGRTDLMSRLQDVRKREIVEERIKKMTTVSSILKDNEHR